MLVRTDPDHFYLKFDHLGHVIKFPSFFTALLKWISHFAEQELNLSFGEITEEAALAVAHAVKDKDQLEKLDLNGNSRDHV